MLLNIVGRVVLLLPNAKCTVRAKTYKLSLECTRGLEIAPITDLKQPNRGRLFERSINVCHYENLSFSRQLCSKGLPRYILNSNMT